MCSYDKKFSIRGLMIVIAIAIIIGLAIIIGDVQGQELEPLTPEQLGEVTYEGRISYYHYRPWMGTIEQYQSYGLLPNDDIMNMYQVHVAIQDCGKLGWSGELDIYSYGEYKGTWSAIVFDCAGEDAYLFTHEDGTPKSWLEEWGFLGEVDYDFAVEYALPNGWMYTTATRAVLRITPHLG